ncbi:Uncharacterised protein [Nocardia africana]|uniref:PhnB-like domain-containing protein n=1 Tax=Nocardia africana TaxID=134964 RepID=A0A378WUJ3_9NOCA|nr:Uncharacterised protein [Nocardia africana]
MSLNAVAHLNFHGQAREALEFYQSVFGGQLTVATYSDFGMPADLPGSDHVVFGQVVADNGFQVMAYDVPASTPRPLRARPPRVVRTAPRSPRSRSSSPSVARASKRSPRCGRVSPRARP